jgi:hypothetical protein
MEAAVAELIVHTTKKKFGQSINKKTSIKGSYSQDFILLLT